MTGLGARFDSIRDSVGPLCVGIDPSTESLTSVGLEDSAEGALEFGRLLVSAATSRVGIVKPQVAFFERFGAAGYVTLEVLIREARAAGLVVIADAKRGDIGTSMQGYVNAWLGNGPLHSDALTVSPYQGFDSLDPAFAVATTEGATIFVLCATSNADATQIQSASKGDQTLPAFIAGLARQRVNPTNCAGVVVGATRGLAASGLTERDVDGLLILSPGFGAQGASLSDLPTIFGSAANRVIPSVSRSVVRDGLSNVGASIEKHLRELAI